MIFQWINEQKNNNHFLQKNTSRWKRKLQVDASGTIFKAMNLSAQTVTFQRRLTLSERKNLGKWGNLNYFLTEILSILTFNVMLVQAIFSFWFYGLLLAITSTPPSSSLTYWPSPSPVQSPWPLASFINQSQDYKYVMDEEMSWLPSHPPTPIFFPIIKEY